PANGRIGELLGEIAEHNATIAMVDPELGLIQLHELAGAVRRGLEEVPEKESLASSRAVFGTLAHLVASTACGAPSPEFASIERAWLGDLAKTHMSEGLAAPLLRSVAYAALGAGVPALVPLLFGDPPRDARRRAAPPNDPIATLLHLAQALEEKW